MNSELREVATNWKSIAFALRLKPKVLDGIQAESSGDPPACLASVITEWLMRNYNVKRFGEPTWQQLVKAVGHPLGGANMALAREIANRHKAKSVANIAVTGETTRKHKAKAAHGARMALTRKIARRHEPEGMLLLVCNCEHNLLLPLM